MRYTFLLISALFALSAPAQKKPLDHSVYDGWQSIGERLISADGRWVAYTVNPQEGDGILYVHNVQNGQVQQAIPRGYKAQITADGRYLICRIKAPFADTRTARIKKKKPEEMPKDSLAIIDLLQPSVVKMSKIASYKLPQENGAWLAIHKEKEVTKAAVAAATQKSVDSLQRKVDSLLQVVTQLKNIKGGNADVDADEPGDGANGSAEGSDLVLRNLQSGREKTFANVGEYHFDKKGQKLLLKVLRKPGNVNTKNAVVLIDLQSEKADTLLQGGNDFRNLTFSEDGSKVAFVAERDSSAKALQKFYGLYLYTGKDTAQKIVVKNTAGMPANWTVSEWGQITFSKSGNRLFFGTAPIRAPKDTTLIEADLVKVDIWHYKDDYLQTQQLFGLQRELKRSYAAMFDLQQQKMIQLADRDFTVLMQTGEGDGNTFFVTTDTGRRVQSQWAGRTPRDLYAVDAATGKRTLVKKAVDGNIYASTTGKYVVWYDAVGKQYFSWDGTAVRSITNRIPHPLYNEEHDLPNEPSPYGVMGWHEQDSALYVYDKYDVWRVDPAAKAAPALMFADAKNRTQQQTFRYVKTDSTEKYFTANGQLLFRVFDHKKKVYHLQLTSFASNGAAVVASPFARDGFNYSNVEKATNAPAFMYTKERFTHSPDIYVNTTLLQGAGNKAIAEMRLSHTNPQQSDYNWGTAELFRWTTFNGKRSEGILYKPEDFDSTKQYPVLIYFYEKLTDGLNNYHAPAPTPSRLNIPFFVSRGYIVFAPDISYTKGQPAKDAYNYIVSGAQALAKHKWVDAKNMGIQGQSWGGYQVVALLVQTGMFKAAWAGAPVANMTSAYGGIRWESGANRQFQYEKQQSRIGATLWERPDLYIQNSPLFQLPKVKTPLVIMANDADGAVPWYQGIELFTAMRRLGKPVWMLNYNGEAHNLVERKNRKDIQIRQQQYFDWLLKGAAPTRWIVEGVPAIEKGKSWGLEAAANL